MRSLSLNRWLILLTAAVISAYSFIGCSKNSNAGNTARNDSTDTAVHHTVAYDSAKFLLTFNLKIDNTNNIYEDDYSDTASMIVYVVNGLVKVPHDSIKNFPPTVLHPIGSSGAWSAIWVPDTVGEINITDAQGLVLDDTSVAMNFTHKAIEPEWKISFMGGPYSASGGDSAIGWPPVILFNPKLKSQQPIDLVQPGSSTVATVRKEY